jgi:hypothetical protein
MFKVLMQNHLVTAAGKCLNRIREMTPEVDKFHRWATRYLKTVCGMAEKD